MVQQHGGGPARRPASGRPTRLPRPLPEGGAGAPPAEAAQEDQPTTPGGEEQNGGETQPDETVETEDDGGVVPDGAATRAPPRAACPRPDSSSAMAVIGLGLLMLGAALRPGRSASAGRLGRARAALDEFDDQRTTRAALTVAALLLKVRKTFKSIRKKALLRLSFLPAV